MGWKGAGGGTQGFSHAEGRECDGSPRGRLRGRGQSRPEVHLKGVQVRRRSALFQLRSWAMPRVHAMLGAVGRLHAPLPHTPPPPPPPWGCCAAWAPPHQLSSLAVSMHAPSGDHLTPFRKLELGHKARDAAARGGGGGAQGPGDGGGEVMVEQHGIRAVTSVAGGRGNGAAACLMAAPFPSTPSPTHPSTHPCTLGSHGTLSKAAGGR